LRPSLQTPVTDRFVSVLSTRDRLLR
jgi:hypothetical protein